MILLRIPFTLGLAWAMHVSMTPPNPPTKEEDKVNTRPTVSSLMVIPTLQKVFAFSTALLEILVVLAYTYPSTPLSNWVLAHLTHSSFLNSTLFTNPIYLLAWAASVIAAIVRKRCYAEMGTLFTSDVGILKNHRLVTTGPYAWVRHPSYTTALLTTHGVFICHCLPGAYFMEELSVLLSPSIVQTSAIALTLVNVIAGAVILEKRIGMENEMLRKEFGSQWDDWVRRVPYNLVPGVW